MDQKSLRYRSIHFFLPMSAILLGLGACRTPSPKAPTRILEVTQIPAVSDCQTGPQMIPCVNFDEGRGGETSQKIEGHDITFTWIGDLGQLYDYYGGQLGMEFDAENDFPGLSFEDDQILVVADAQSSEPGRKVHITKIEADIDEWLVYVETWRPKKKASGCKSFNLAISRPYHMVKVKKASALFDGKFPTVEIIADHKVYKCSAGQVLE